MNKSKNRVCFYAICYDCGWRSGAMWEDAELPGQCCECGGDEIGMELRLLSELGPCDSPPGRK